MSNQTYDFQWNRNGKALVGETGATYTLQAADVGTEITATVTATDTAGSTSATTTEIVIVATADPDMVVTAIGGVPGTITAGQQLTFTATVENQGTGATPAGIVTGVAFIIDGTEVTYSDNFSTSIGADDSVTLTADNGSSGVAYWTATAGSHTLEAYVNDIGRYAESNTDNNTLVETIVVGVVTVTVPTNTTGTQAITADSFIDFIGAGGNIIEANGTQANPPLIAAILKDLGIRHIRSGWSASSTTDNNILINLNQTLGVKMSWIMLENSSDTPAQARAYMVANSKLMACIDGIEGPNEWDLQGKTSQIASYQQTIWEAFHTGATVDLPIIGPSFGAATTASNFETVGNISAYMNYSNAHDYQGSSDGEQSFLNEIVSVNSITGPNLKIVTTESGWCDAPGEAANAANGYGGYTDTSPARVIVAGSEIRMHFMKFIDGHWLRSTIYDLIDDNLPVSNTGFGLVENTGETFSTTPTATELHSYYKPQAWTQYTVNALLGDLNPDEIGMGMSFTPGKLDYTIAGTTSNTQTCLLQRSNGDFWLAIWEQDVQLWNFSNGTTISPAPSRISMTLTLGQSTATTIAQYHTTTGGNSSGTAASTTPVSTVSNVASTAISSGAEVSLVKIVIL